MISFRVAFFVFTMFLWPAISLAVSDGVSDIDADFSSCINDQFLGYATPSRDKEINLVETCSELAEYLLEINRELPTNTLPLEKFQLATLLDLQYFVHRANNLNLQQNEIDLSRLQSILSATLIEKGIKKLGWWQRFLNWLNSRDEAEQSDNDYAWLQELLNNFSLSDETAKGIFYVSSGLIIILTLFLVLRELYLSRQSGYKFWRRGKNKNKKNNVAIAAKGNKAAFSFETKAASLPALLNQCIDFLIYQGKLPSIKSKTNREYIHYLVSNCEEIAEPFSTISVQAERVIYGGWKADDVTIEHCVELSKSILKICSSDENDGVLAT